MLRGLPAVRTVSLLGTVVARHVVLVLLMAGYFLLVPYRLGAADAPTPPPSPLAPLREDLTPPAHACWEIPEVDQLLDQAAHDDAAWTRAVEALRPWRVIALVQAAVRLHGQHDLAATRLMALRADHLADHRGIAESVWKASEALATCAGNEGPRHKEFGTTQLAMDRQLAKIVHFFFVSDKPFRVQLESADFWQVSSTDWRDEQAAAELYQLAARLYDALAAKDADAALRSADAARAAQARAQAAHCQALYAHLN